MELKEAIGRRRSIRIFLTTGPWSAPKCRRRWKQRVVLRVPAM